MEKNNFNSCNRNMTGCWMWRWQSSGM